MRCIKSITFIIYLMVLMLFSCNSDFSKYKKNGENDLEKEHLIGNVHKRIRYYNGKIADIHCYNKYGFLTKYKGYSDGEIVEERIYTYNEYGKIESVETKNKKCRYVHYTQYDEYGYVIEEYKETYEVYDTSCGEEIGKRLLDSYENKYDKLGGLICSKCLRRDGTCRSESKYNDYGQLTKTINFNENGIISSFVDYKYSGNKIIEERKTIPGYSKYLDSYFIHYYSLSGELIKWAHTYEDGSFSEIREYEFDYNGFPVKETYTWVAGKPVSWMDSKYKEGDICHTITIYNRDDHGSLIKEIRMTYYPNEDITNPKEPEKTKVFQYKYDVHGNIIYEKDDDGNEYKYEITYY